MIENNPWLNTRQGTQFTSNAFPSKLFLEGRSVCAQFWRLALLAPSFIVKSSASAPGFRTADEAAAHIGGVKGKAGERIGGSSGRCSALHFTPLSWEVHRARGQGITSNEVTVSRVPGELDNYLWKCHFVKRPWTLRTGDHVKRSKGRAKELWLCFVMAVISRFVARQHITAPCHGCALHKPNYCVSTLTPKSPPPDIDQTSDLSSGPSGSGGPWLWNSLMPSLTMAASPVLAAFGNPLLDIIVREDCEGLVEKYGLARNIAQEVDTLKTGLHAEVTAR